MHRNLSFWQGAVFLFASIAVYVLSRNPFWVSVDMMVFRTQPQNRQT
jgi:hypothetical protein